MIKFATILLFFKNKFLMKETKIYIINVK